MIELTKNQLRWLLEEAYDSGDDTCGLAKHYREARKFRREIIDSIVSRPLPTNVKNTNT